MNIFLSFLQSPQQYPEIPAYQFWEYYIKSGITEAGFEWDECPGADWALGLVPKSEEEHSKWKQEIWEKTLARLKENPADIFLSYLYPDQIDSSAIEEIQKMGIPCVNFFCDHVREFKVMPSEFKVFDLNWVPEHKALKLYKKAERPFLNLPMPMWVDPRYRVLKKEKNNQVTFIGSRDIQRILLFEKVLQLDPSIPLTIYGKGWQGNIQRKKTLPADYTLTSKIKFNIDIIDKQGVAGFLRKLNRRNLNIKPSDALIAKTHASPSFEEYNDLTAESMITLGINRYPSFRFPLSKPGSYSRLRDIEAPMLGACYLTEQTEGIEDLYDTDKEIKVYKTAEELLEKVNELNNDPAMRKMLRASAQKRALSDHSIPVSLNKIITAVGLKQKA